MPKRSWLLILVNFLFGWLAFAFATNVRQSGREGPNLAGTWDVVKLVDDQEAAPARALRNMAVVIKDNRLVLTTEQETQTADIALDTATVPRKIDLHWKKEKVTCWGIYELKGESATICSTVFEDGVPESDRPKTFAPKDQRTILIGLMRKEK